MTLEPTQRGIIFAETLGKEVAVMSCGTGECGCGCDDLPLLQIHMKGKGVEEEASEEEVRPLTFAAQ